MVLHGVKGGSGEVEIAGHWHVRDQEGAPEFMSYVQGKGNKTNQLCSWLRKGLVKHFFLKESFSATFYFEVLVGLERNLDL